MDHSPGGAATFTRENAAMKTIVYIFAILAGFWSVLYISPLVFLGARLIESAIHTVNTFGGIL